MNDDTPTRDGTIPGVSDVHAATSTVQVHCDYISADAPIHRAFPSDTVILAVKDWARGEFVPNPPSDKTFYLNDDKTRHRFTEEDELRTLASLGYKHGAAHFRLNEEQASGASSHPRSVRRGI